MSKEYGARSGWELEAGGWMRDAVCGSLGQGAGFGIQGGVGGGGCLGAGRGGVDCTTSWKIARAFARSYTV